MVFIVNSIFRMPKSKNRYSYPMYTKKLFLVLAASCLAFQPGVAPSAHAMLPVGDSAHRNFYKNQDFIWETNKTDSSVGSAAPAVASPQEVTSKLPRPVPTEVAFLFPPPRSEEQVAFFVPPPPRSEEQVAFFVPPPPRSDGDVA
jgi:hypothetical protein